MQYLVLDTCIILHILRNKVTGQAVMNWLSSLASMPVIVISVVTRAELESLKVQQGWGTARCNALNAFLAQVTYVDISHADTALLAAYAQIDAYSKGKGNNPAGNKKPGSANTMGKNDLWIAATAHVLGTTLVTADGDFDHLNGTFLTVKKF